MNAAPLSSGSGPHDPHGDDAPAPGFGAGSGAEGGRSGTLARGLALMDLLVGAARPMALTEIDAALGLDPATAMRLLRALAAQGRVIRLGDGRRYAASPAALRPLPLLHPVDQVRRETAPLIRGLAERLRLSVALIVFLGHERLVIDVALTPGSPLPYPAAWLKGPLHATGPGKALLMALDEARAAALLGPGPYRAHTSDTRITAASVRADLAAARARGYATVRDEFYPGLSSVSAPFSTWSGRPAGCLAVSFRSAVADDRRMAEMGQAVADIARLIPPQAVSLDRLDAFAP